MPADGKGVLAMVPNNGEQLEGMEDGSYRELRLLEEVESTPQVSQRRLASQLGVALGVANILVRSLAQKGYIRATKLGWKRWVYLVTPAGFARKVQLTVNYVDRFLDHYRRVRALVQQDLSSLTMNKESRVAIYGTPELSQLVYLTLRDMGITEIDLFDRVPGPGFMGSPVQLLDSFDPGNYDEVIVASGSDAEARCAEMNANGVPDSQIVALLQNSFH
jgi:DNA-binding MarR family transcriptional regulator